MFARVAITGAIQGSHRGLTVDDQRYRSVIPAMFARYIPGVECFDPSVPVIEQLSDSSVVAAVTNHMESFAGEVSMSTLGPEVSALRSTFLEMTRRVGDCDLCVAFLPDEISMGTAMEMYAAHSKGVPIITVTKLVENLAIASVSDWIVQDLEALEGWIARVAKTLSAGPCRPTAMAQ